MLHLELKFTKKIKPPRLPPTQMSLGLQVDQTGMIGEDNKFAADQKVPPTLQGLYDRNEFTLCRRVVLLSLV